MKSHGTRVEIEAPEQKCSPRMPICAGFVYGGMLAGWVLGLYEAVLLYTRPRYSVGARPDLGPPIFLVAPLTDLLAFGLLGLVLGYFAEKSDSPAGSEVRRFCTAGLGLAGGFAWGVTFLRLWWDENPKLIFLALVVIAGGIGVSLLSAAALRKWEHRRGGITPTESAQWIRRLRIVAVSIGVILLGCVAVYEVRGPDLISSPPARLTDSAARPNIILITIDAAPANHFSCYGYSRKTTPNLDRLATGGVQFENAIAPSSWTLPSFASMFTGLLPHQHGADSRSPLPERFPTLAMALKSAGYQTVGFNANLAYGQTSQGIARGFDLYEDGSENLRQNFAQTMYGRAFVRFVYMPFVEPDWPERQSAEEINRKVLRWFPHRTPGPYFLFINYYDVHFPYFAPRPFAKRYGELPHEVAQQIDSDVHGVAPPAITPAEKAYLVAGFDNTLAYADSQIAVLMQFLAKTPDWSNTVVIITSDHGETLGEHGHFGHGWSLSSELVHVPLIILGPGVPAGLHVHDVVGTRRLYATILDLAQGGTTGSLRAASLQNYWSGKQDSISKATLVISEVNSPTLDPRRQNSYISLNTPQWHWILDAHGHSQLFDWVKDPQENADLAGSPEAGKVVEALERALHERLMASPRPWAGLSYLQPVGLGISPPASPRDRDLLDSLPYQ